MNKLVKSVIQSKQVAAIGIIIIGLLIYAPGLMAQDNPSYHNYDEMTKELKRLVNANSSIAKIESIGKTIEGRDLWVVTIANPDGAPVIERPGMLIAANFEGDHLIGSEIALSVIDQLLNTYKSDDAVKGSIDDHVYYIIPRMNPDAAERMFESIKTGIKTNINKYDGDNDGRIDEDGPDDLNKDGYITMMRVKDENGKYMIVKDEPRLMKKADPAKGESGIYSIYWEGTDNDKDGFINEDPMGGTDINRNFMHEYPYFNEDAGWHMVSENESRALMEWVIEHRNIAIMLNFGESDNLIVPPGSKGTLSSDQGIDLVNMANESYAGAAKVGMVSTTSAGRYGNWYRSFSGGQDQQNAQASGRQRPDRKAETTFSTDDLEYFKNVSDMYKEITGIKTQPPLRDPKGAFFQYGYFQFGALSLSTSGWGIDMEGEDEGDRRKPGGEDAGEAPKERGERGPMPQGRTANGPSKATGIDNKFLNWLDKNNIDGFIEWQAYTHPEFGEVEIGGFTPYEINNPPADKIQELAEAHGKYAVWLSGLYANVSIAKTEVINHGGGIFRIKAEVENDGFLPTALSQGVTSRAVSPTMVQLEVKPELIISGNAKTNFFQALSGSGERQKYEWLVQGKSGDQIELKVVSDKAGTDKTTITLK
ncbi:M14 family metallopeptidase [Bacteroidota bacterium]